ncbi:MAG TPA: ROK family protein [Melioribacteraceae bacterium]|nr:ROK family protein [Melioribacteraceae bacterium]
MGKKGSLAIGVDLGGTNIKIGLVTKSGEIVNQVSVESKANNGPKAVIKQIEHGIDRLLECEKRDVIGIGIGAPGSVTVKKGIVENPPNFTDWGSVALGSILKKKLKTEVFVENDANAAAIGELIFGAGKKLNSFIMITLGTGLGGGIIFDKKIFRGDTGAAGELGHVTIDYNGNRCNCGSIGCVEAYTGNNYFMNWVKPELEKHPQSLIYKFIENDLHKLTPYTIHQAAEQGDFFAIDCIKQLGRYVGYGLVSAINILDISNVVIGGGVAGFGNLLFDEILHTVNERILIPKKGKIKIIPAMFKNNAGIIGASALVYYRL